MSNKNNFFSIANNLENLEENKGYLIWIRCGAFLWLYVLMQLYYQIY